MSGLEKSAMSSTKGSGAGVGSGDAEGAATGAAAQTPKIGVRSTRQRKAVIAAMNDITKFSSAKDIHRVLVERGDQVGLTTVYRTLQSLSEVKAVDVLHTDAGEALYGCAGIIITITWCAPIAVKPWRSAAAPWRNGRVTSPPSMVSG